MNVKENNPLLQLLQQFVGQDMRNSPSPFGRWLNGRLRSIAHGKAEIAYEVRAEMLNPAGLLHGGIITSMLDDALGVTMFGLGYEEFFTSINLSVDFLAAAGPGETVIAYTEVQKEGRSLAYATAWLENEAGKVLARVSSNMLKSHFKPARPTTS